MVRGRRVFLQTQHLLELLFNLLKDRINRVVSIALGAYLDRLAHRDRRADWPADTNLVSQILFKSFERFKETLG